MRHLPTTVMRTTPMMMPLLIKPINLTKRTKQIHEPQHTHGLTDQTNLGNVFRKTADGRPHKLRGITQIIMFRGGRFLSLFAAAHFQSLPLCFR